MTSLIKNRKKKEEEEKKKKKKKKKAFTHSMGAVSWKILDDLVDISHKVQCKVKPKVILDCTENMKVHTFRQNYWQCAA